MMEERMNNQDPEVLEAEESDKKALDQDGEIEIEIKSPDDNNEHQDSEKPAQKENEAPPVDTKNSDEPAGEDVPVDEAASKPEDNANKYLEQVRRAQAEFQNYKKRVEKERGEFSNYTKGELIRRLLPIVDDFDRFIENHADDSIIEGFKLIHDKLMSTLKEEGLEKITAKGDVFDPNLHDALYTQAVDDDEDDGKVLEEWEKGFFFKGRLLRPSKVKVGKKKETTA